MSGTAWRNILRAQCSVLVPPIVSSRTQKSIRWVCSFELRYVAYKFSLFFIFIFSFFFYFLFFFRTTRSKQNIVQDQANDRYSGWNYCLLDDVRWVHFSPWLGANDDSNTIQWISSQRHLRHYHFNLRHYYVATKLRLLLPHDVRNSIRP